MCVARAFCAAVSLRPKRGGLGRALRRFTFTSSACLPRRMIKSTSFCLALMAVRVKATLSAGHSSSPKKEEVYSTVSPALMPALAALPPPLTPVTTTPPLSPFFSPSVRPSGLSTVYCGRRRRGAAVRGETRRHGGAAVRARGSHQHAGGPRRGAGRAAAAARGAARPARASCASSPDRAPRRGLRRALAWCDACQPCGTGLPRPTPRAGRRTRISPGMGSCAVAPRGAGARAARSGAAAGSAVPTKLELWKAPWKARQPKART
jgi:hypothetical protein